MHCFEFLAKLVVTTRGIGLVRGVALEEIVDGRAHQFEILIAFEKSTELSRVLQSFRAAVAERALQSTGKRDCGKRTPEIALQLLAEQLRFRRFFLAGNRPHFDRQLDRAFGMFAFREIDPLFFALPRQIPDLLWLTNLKLVLQRFDD